MNNSTFKQQPSIKVIIEQGDSAEQEYQFNNSFCIGRGEECEVQLIDGVVSRKHLKIYLLNGEWWLSDANSRNGSFIDGQKIINEKLQDQSRISLGKDGPIINVTIEVGEMSKLFNHQQDQTVTEYIDHYFAKKKDDNNIGEHTMMVRQAYEVVKKKHTSKYIISIIAIAVIAIFIGIYAIYQNIRANEQKILAENIFYEMKSMEIELAKLSEVVMSSGSQKAIESMNQLRNRHLEMERKYDQFIDDFGIYDMDDETRIILRMARIFGECELNIPSGFIGEVKNYIKKWQSSSRLVKALNRAKVNGYNEIILKKMNEYHLPGQFYYLALQESDFKGKIVGPKTRYGYAKGIWQFISSTAVKYGLKIGPLREKPHYDPRDDRFNFVKATDAAARYINDIYSTEAQASGLLVMASYNWGEHNVRELVRKYIMEMPENPKERNFWRLLEVHRKDIPNETYNYVFYIFSAAVICENPRLFGFNFEKPLSDKNY